MLEFKRDLPRAVVMMRVMVGVMMVLGCENHRLSFLPNRVPPTQAARTKNVKN
jgi:hypothetical protein